jgi:hypothetical protein
MDINHNTVKLLYNYSPLHRAVSKSVLIRQRYCFRNLSPEPVAILTMPKVFAMHQSMYTRHQRGACYSSCL